LTVSRAYCVNGVQPSRAKPSTEESKKFSGSRVTRDPKSFKINRVPRALEWQSPIAFPGPEDNVPMVPTFTHPALTCGLPGPPAVLCEISE
jgi:hypothetical protein